MEAAVSDNVPSKCSKHDTNLTDFSDEEDPDEYPFPLTLKQRTGPGSPLDGIQGLQINGSK